MAQEPSSFSPSAAPADATSRREFVKRGVAAAAVPVLAACSSSPPPQPAPAPPPGPEPAAGAQPVAPSAPPQRQNQQERDPVAEQLTDALKAKYHDRLTDEQWDEVRRGVEGNLRAAKALHDFTLPIQAEPAFVFRAYRGGER
jgi:hypothetical protein